MTGGARSSFGFGSSRNASVRPENSGRNALAATIGWYLCFAVFVIAGVFIFTFKSADADGAIKIGEEDNFVQASSDHTFINISDVESAVAQYAEPVVSEARDCRRVDEPIDCRDPDVFNSLMRAAIEKFKNVRFYRFAKPVRGDNGSSCHMAWRFKPKQGKLAAASIDKDYRAFTVVRFENCTVSVVGIGDLHSGGKARKRHGKDKLELGKADAGKRTNRAFPDFESEDSFSRGKYLIYSGGGDRCKSMNQYLWSFLCMLGEAQYLNRTLVIDLSICLSKLYSSSGVDEEGKDFSFYFDFKHLKRSASVLDQAQFWAKWNNWYQKNGLSLHLVEDFKITPMQLAGLNKDTLIMRKFGIMEPDNYWYRVCEGEAGSVVPRPWHKLTKSRHLLDVASAIVSRMNWDFDSVRVERGEKASNKDLWPNLDRDAQPEALLKTLHDKIEGGRNLYIVTNEPDKAVFNALKDKYSIHFLDDYKDLWDTNSHWYDETMRLNSRNAVEFDGYMRICVDTEVFLRGKRQIETFNDLTKDCKDGINTCTKTG